MHPNEAFSTRKRTPKSTGAFSSFGSFYAAGTWRKGRPPSPPLFLTNTNTISTLENEPRMARFWGWLLLFNTTITTLENEHMMLVFEGGYSSPTPAPSHPRKRAYAARFWEWFLRAMMTIITTTSTLKNEHIYSFSKVFNFLVYNIFNISISI